MYLNFRGSIVSKLFFSIISIFISFQVIPVSAEEKARGAEILQKANSGNCQSYVGYALGNEMLQRLHDYAKLFYIEDVIFTISGGNSMLKLRREGYREIIANEIDVLLKSGDDLSLDELPDAYVDGFYSGSQAVKAGEFLNGKNDDVNKLIELKKLIGHTNKDLHKDITIEVYYREPMEIKYSK